jgi:hypothetical protein
MRSRLAFAVSLPLLVAIPQARAIAQSSPERVVQDKSLF